jgi:hypothetical protein
MPDRQDDLNAVPDLGPFAEALKRLDPQPPDLSRDALLFAAGQASAQPRLGPWVWPTIAAGFAALSLVFGAFAISPSGPGDGDRVQYVYLQPPPSAGPASTRSEEPVHVADAPATRPKPKAKSAEDLERDRMLQVRRDVLRWGVDMLSEPKSAGGPGPSPDVVARELNRWLNLPPGTFTAPALQPKKPEPKDDENDQ